MVMVLERVAYAAYVLAGFTAVLGAANSAQAQSGLQIQWEVANRFRLFAEQQDFDRQVAAARATDGTWKSVLDTEHTLEGSEGRGWSQSVRLCYDKVRNRVLAKCDRDGTVENYLNPETSRIRLTAVVPRGFDAVNCTWTIGSGKPVTQPCDTPLDNERVSLKKATPVHLLAQAADGKSLQADASVAPRDVLVVGFGDSMAAGEGNPDKPIALSD